MKLTNKQKKEIDYLKTWSKNQVTDSDVSEFVLVTTKGIGKSGKFSSNPLVIAQYRLGVTMKMWEEDLQIGLITINELIEEAYNDYEKNLIYKIRKNLWHY